MAGNQSTLQFIEIADIRDDIVILKNGTLRAVLEVGSINFELRSQDEQTAILHRFQEFLNSLDFPVQIVVSSRKLNIKSYLQELEELIKNLDNELLRIQAIEYSRYIKGLVELANIMSRHFYIVVPFYFIESVSKGGFLKNLGGIFKTSSALGVQQLSDEQFQTFSGQLRQRLALVEEGLSSMSLKTRLLSKDELANLYYQLYNPRSPETLKLEDMQPVIQNLKLET